MASRQYANGPLGNVTLGGWIIDDPEAISRWVDEQLKELKSAPDDVDEAPSITRFRKLIEHNPEVYMGFIRMLDPGTEEESSGDKQQINDYNTMLKLFNRILGQAPKFSPSLLVLLPFTAILHKPMTSPAGPTILINPLVNGRFRDVFQDWYNFLGSQDSAYVLHTGSDGWLGEEAMKLMPNFKETFVCHPDQPHWGFRSWDRFFTRKLRQGARPVASPEDPTVVTSACESKVLRVAYNVQKRDRFWIKGQPYSITHMLNNSDDVPDFIGGTVYQAFLSPFYYHRWSSPVDGTIKKVDLIDGTYFAGMPIDTPENDVALQGQQAFISHVATRALVFIDADNKDIGLVCFIAVGMVEVSTCQVIVREGDHVNKGDELGTFHFGGSTHCVVFGPQVALNFTVQAGDFVKVHSQIATASPS